MNSNKQADADRLQGQANANQQFALYVDNVRFARAQGYKAFLYSAWAQGWDMGPHVL
jgi:hypothetical protein